MKKVLIILFCMLSCFAHSQSWQWGKRGGSVDQLGTTGGFRQEEVYAIVTDSQKNIYTLSNVGMNNLNIDGNVKTNFGDPTTLTDVALSSFACDGTYRWSKIIGGGGKDIVNSLQIDAQDNIYIAGKFGSCQDDTYPPRIDSDVILHQSPEDCSLIFIAKFNSSGVMQWFKRPQAAGVDPNVGYPNFSKGLATDSAGNSYWLTLLIPGSYCNGAFNPTMTGSNFYVLKYDTNGNFVSGTYLDMQLTLYAFLNLQFYRNPYNGYYYMTSTRSDSGDTAIVGGQTINTTAFLTCFTDLGQFQWVRQNSYTTPGGLTFYNIAFDSQNNIYIGGKYLGFGLDTFIGFTDPTPGIPSFVMKVNPTADTLLWSTYHNKGTSNYGAIIVKGNEVGFTSYCYDPDFAWGGQTLVATAAPGQATEVLFARFNATTGACLSLNKIPGDVGYDDKGTALAVDASGDYILGGSLGHQLTFTTNTITNIGSQSDFFVAKYSTSVCSLHTEDFKEEGLELAPNPVVSTVRINTQETLHYQLYSISGVLVKEGTVDVQDTTIDFSGMAVGTYLLKTVNGDGKVRYVKLVKE